MGANLFTRLARDICLGILSAALVSSSRAQSNIVFNGGFENAADGWEYYPGVEIHLDQGAPEGRIHVGVDDYLYQDLPTVAGRDYVLTFASPISPRPTVQWDDTPVTNLTNFAVSGPSWKYVYAYAHAQSNSTRLRFNGYGPLALLDDVKVRWVQDPLQLTEQPASRTAFEGGTVSFSVQVDGPPPLQYQWFFNASPIVGASASTVVAAGLRTNQAGQYSVLVSNAWHSLSSSTAQLQVLPPPTSPVIVSQPASEFWPAGYACNLSVFAVGDPVLEYQWMFNGDPLAGATNAILTFGALQSTNAGTYSVLVSNQHGTVLSLPAVLTVTTSSGGGSVFFDTFTNNAPVYDANGATLLAGTNFMAQAYAGAAPNILRPVGAAVAFQTANRAGYLPQFTRQIPDVPPGQTAYIQLRAWESLAGRSYEQARASGGKFGFSGIYPTVANGNRVATTAFSLRAGEPFFVAGQLGLGESLPSGRQQFILTGERAARYLIETLQPPNNWVPLLVLTNTTGTSVFTDTNQFNESLHLYRARLLD